MATRRTSYWLSVLLEEQEDGTVVTRLCYPENPNMIPGKVMPNVKVSGFDYMARTFHLREGGEEIHIGIDFGVPEGARNVTTVIKDDDRNGERDW